MTPAEEAAEVFRRIARGEDEIVRCEPEWTKAWCENVDVTTKLGFKIVIFHRWGAWKYTDSVHAPDGRRIWDYDQIQGWTEPQSMLPEEEQERLYKLLNPVDPEHYFNKREVIRETDPKEYHRLEAERHEELAKEMKAAGVNMFVGYCEAMASAHRKEAAK